VQARHDRSRPIQTDMARSTQLVILIKNIYTLWGRKPFLLPVTYFPTSLVYPFTLRVTGINTEAIICFIYFPDPTFILPAKYIRLLGKFQPDSFKSERLVCVETDGQTDMARSTRLVMLIKNMYTLWGRKRLLHCVANF